MAREAEVAAHWARGAWRGMWIETQTGERWRIIFEGRRGGPAGPDFRDAVLESTDGRVMRGDIELHLRAQGWESHGHHEDARYDGVILHLVCQAPGHRLTTALHSGAQTFLAQLPVPGALPTAPWPCAPLARSGRPLALRALLLWAGLMRLRERAARLAASPTPPELVSVSGWSEESVRLWLALAEGLGYGRDRELMREAGADLLRSPGDVMDGLAGVDRQRATGLARWRTGWAAAGPWPPLQAILLSEVNPLAAGKRLRAALTLQGHVSSGRAAILVANAVVPLALGDPSLADRAEAIFLALPGLPSNTLTREMARTLGLRRIPRGAAAQQGLQHLWAHWCQAKRCATCPCNVAGGTFPA